MNIVEVTVRANNDTKAGLDSAKIDFSKAGKVIGDSLKGIGGAFAASGLLAAAMPLGAAGVAMGAFGAVAAPTLSKVEKALSSTGKAGKQAWANLDPAQTAIAKNIQGLQRSFDGIAKAAEPLVTQVTSLALTLARDLLPALSPMAKAGATLIGDFLKPMDALLRSSTFKKFSDSISGFATQIGPMLGTFLTSLVKIMMQLFIQLMPQGVKILGLLLPAFSQMLTSIIPIIAQLASWVAASLKWLSANKLLIPALWGVVAALVAAKLAMSPVATAIAVLALLIIKYHKQIWDAVVNTWNAIKNFIVSIWNNIMSFAKQWWPLLLGPGGLILKYHAQIEAGIKTAWNAVLSFLRGIWNTIKSAASTAWNSIWANTVTRAKNGVTDVVNWVKTLPGKIVSSLGNAGKVLLSWGKGVINGLLSGMSSIIGSVWTFIKGIPKKILNFLGIASPPKWSIEAGKHIMNGLGIGMTQAKDVMGKAVTASTSQFSAGNLVASVGSGVNRWRGLILQALKMEGLPSSLVGMILTQMQSESGGNPNAINLWDSNAAAGHPSKGLMQVIGPTFAAYHWPGTSSNIYDPLANIAAALNYAAHNRGFGSGPGQVGSGHGYAAGGITSPGWAWVGEHGRELLKLPGGATVYPAGQSAQMAAGGAQKIHVTLELGPNFQRQTGLSQQQLTDIRYAVRTHGGGSVQRAFGLTQR